MNRRIALWKESGRWWNAEPELECARYLDAAGIVRERTREYPCTVISRSDDVPTDRDREASRTVDYEVWKRESRTARGELERLNALESQRVQSMFVALHCVSAYSFGRSSLTPERIAALAYAGGMSAVAITDRFSLSGASVFCRSARELGIKPIVGATVEMEDGGELVLIVASENGYKNLSQLITRCHLEEPRQFPLCNWDRLAAFSDGVICLTGGHSGALNHLLMSRRKSEAKALLGRLTSIFSKDRTYIEIERSLAPWEIAVNRLLIELSNETNVNAVAGGKKCHASREDFAVQDALLCAETLCTVEEIVGRKPQRDPSQKQLQSPIPQRWLNAERRFQTGMEWERLFADAPELVKNAARIAKETPEWPLPPRPSFPTFGDAPECILRNVVYQGAGKRYMRVSPSVSKRLSVELSRIIDLGYASHFLAIWEACQWARSKGILYSARGSVVDSAVAYCLGLSRIDAVEHGLHFDRFLPGDGSKRPDIDIDFEAERRNDVREFFAKRYGRECVAGVAAIATYQGRGIVRMIGKALMIPEPAIDYLAKRLHGSVTGTNIEAAIAGRPELRDSGIPRERFHLLFDLASQIDGLPRGMMAHASGLVVSSEPISHTVPVMESGLPNAPIIQWDKYSSKHFFDKFDLLCLRGQDVLSATQSAVRASGDKSFSVERIPLDDEETFDSFRKGSLIGIPQSASPAMRQAHVRLQTRNLHDTSLVQAGIRPGVGGAVKINALIRRRRGIEKYVYPHPLLETILGMSYGIIVFQEQVDQLLQAFCGYTSGEAEEIRDNIHKLRAQDWGSTIRDNLIERCLKNGFSMDVAEHVFDLVSGFRGYGFAQGHALSFAEISIRCTYLQNNFPCEYFAALLSAQPAGYYGPGTIANEARVRGVKVLPLDVNRSEERFVVEDSAIRIGFMQQYQLSKPTLRRILEHRPYRSFFDFCARVAPKADELECLILAGAFDSLYRNRRALLWAIPDAVNLGQSDSVQSALFDYEPDGAIPRNVADFSGYQRAVLERSMLGLDIQEHLMAFERERIAGKGGISCSQANELVPGKKAFVTGHAMRLRFPPTASGRRVVFFDLEDETGLLNVTCFDETYQKDGHSIICSPFVTIVGSSQDRDGHPAFLAQRVFPYHFASDRENFAQERKAVHAEDFIIRKGR